MITNITKLTEYDIDAKFFLIKNLRFTDSGKLKFNVEGYPSRKAANNNMKSIYNEEILIDLSTWADANKANQLVKAIENYIVTLPGFTGSVAE